MKRYITYQLSLILVLLLQLGYSQSSSIKFRHLSINDGLSQSSVNDIIQDQQGFIWVGTQDGLNRFDGYNFTAFRNQAGDSTSLSDNYIWTIFEDREKHLWVGTQKGLNCFNQATETFKRFRHQPNNPNSLSNDYVWSVTQDQRGRLWIGTEHGLNVYDTTSKTFKHYFADGKPGALPSNAIRSLFVDQLDRVWVGTQGGGLCLYQEESNTFQVFAHDPNNQNSISSDIIWSIRGGDENTLWIGTNNGLDHLTLTGDEGRFRRFYHDEKDPLSLSNNTVIAVLRDHDNNIWAGTRSGGLNKLVQKKQALLFQRYLHNELFPTSIANSRVQSLYEDRSGVIWVGTRNGLSFFDPAKQGFNHFTKDPNNPNSLADKQVWSFGEDASGVLWVGTQYGLTRINKQSNTYHHYNRQTNNLNRLTDNSVTSIYCAPDGAVFIGMVDGLFQLELSDNLKTATWIPIQYSDAIDPLLDKRIYCIVPDQAGSLWVGTREGVARIKLADRSYQFFRHNPRNPRSISSNIVRTIVQDQKGTLWIGADAGGLNRVHLDHQGDSVWFEPITTISNSTLEESQQTVVSMLEGADGKMWLGTYGGGVTSYDPATREVRTYDDTKGLANNVICGMLLDRSGNLWLSTNNGLSVFNPTVESFKNFTQNDGLQSNEFNVGAYYKNQRGELYFGGINGYNVFLPENIRSNVQPPQMIITDLKIFNESVEIGPESILKSHVSTVDEVVLAHTENNLTIDFAALHYSHPEKNQYRYILEGAEEKYNWVGGRTSAFYSHLSPGTYTFRVIGANSDGVWAEEEATLTIVIESPFYATWWFLILGILFIGGIVVGAIRYRISIIESQKRKLQIQVGKRTQEVENQKRKIESQKEALEIEKVKTEDLLLNILPYETVEELKANGKATARSYRRATVMFTDFIGFTQIAERFKPAELVSELDSHFVKFDEIIARHEVEKIKTIGDAYMCAGGVPIRNKSNPIDTVLAGLEIQRYMAETRAKKEAEGKEFWGLRVGIHTGEIIAGVIGSKRFAYDIWGDAVNVANRMESSGEIGKVNISGKTHHIIAPLFECTYRGKVAAKNKGEIDMFFVDRIRPLLSENGEGIVPNQKFWDYVNLILYSTINYRHAEKYILKVLETKLPEGLHYHGVHHTIDVCRAAEMYAIHEGITSEELYLLKTAALYHDAGFTKQYADNEPIGVEMGRKVLPRFGYTADQIRIISDLIYVTAIPHQPKSHLEEIMCDADLDYLGRDDFHQVSDNLKRELMERDIVKTDRQWDEIQVKFLNLHQYFTKTALHFRQEKKMIHLAEIEARLQQEAYPDGS